MARKGQVSIQETVETDDEFEIYLENHYNQLICMEVYSDFCGHCLATGNAIRKGKLELGGDLIAMVKVQSDRVEILKRFKNKSEPVFLFIQKGMLTRAIFGSNGVELCLAIEEELESMKKETETGVAVPKFEIAQMLPSEAAKLEDDLKLEEEYREAAERLRVLTLAARKKRVNERLSTQLKRLNFILFWPNCHQAHYDLYEKWDLISISVSAKETLILNEQSAKEALYMSDVDPNEACLHALFSGQVLVVLFKMMETDYRDFVQLLRHALYEEIPEPKEDVPPEKQVPPIPAYERYASISKTAREVRRDRYNAKLQKMREEQEDRDRLAAEQARLAREAEEDRIRVEKQKADEERMARIQAGLPADPEPVPELEKEVVAEGEGEGSEEGGEGEVKGEQKGEEKGEEKGEGKGEGKGVETEAATEVATEVPAEGVLEEEKPEVEEVFHSDEEIEGEDYIPPGGLFVPGLYCPPNELAKANGLAFFFPKVVSQLTHIESEHLPPHVLVMFTIDKRYEVLDIVQQFKDEILAMGVFVGDDPFNVEHIAFTIKQYDKMVRLRKHKDRLAIMVSRQRSLPLLQLAGLNPIYISSDVTAGERDCLNIFPVGYGDEYVEEESIKEEAVPEVLKVEEEREVVVVEEVKVEEEEEEEID